MAFFSAGKGEKICQKSDFHQRNTKGFFLSDVSKMRKARQLLQFIFFIVWEFLKIPEIMLTACLIFKERLIKPGALHEGWQTGGSARLTRLAFNLWNGYVEKGEESLSTPYEMFDCGYAPYFYEAIRIKYPEYCRDLLQVSKKRN